MIRKVYEVESVVCPKCGSQMKEAAAGRNSSDKRDSNFLFHVVCDHGPMSVRITPPLAKK
jgi:hypothetical protein